MASMLFEVVDKKGFGKVYHSLFFKSAKRNGRSHLNLSFKWAMVAFLMAISFIMALSGAFAALLPLIIEDFRISYVQAGYMATLNKIPSIMLPIFTGFLLGKYGLKRMGVISMILEIVGCLVLANAPYYTLTLLGLLIIGAGMAIRSTIFPTIITQLFPSNEVGKPMGFYTASSISIMLVYPLVSAVGIIYGWRMCFYISSIMDIVALIVFWCMYNTKNTNDPYYKNADQVTKKSVWSATFNKELWKIGLFRALEVVGTSSFFVWAPTFITESYNVNLVYASLIPSLFILVCMIFAPVAGSISDKFGKRKYFVIVGCGLWCLFLFLIPLAPTFEVMVLLVIAGGFSSSFIPVLSSALISEIVTSDLSGVGFGIQTVSVGVGSAICAPFIGYIKDLTGSWVTSFMFASLFLAVATLVMATLKTTR